MPTRRRFLAQGLAAGTSLALAARGIAFESTFDSVDAEAIDRLARSLQGILIQPSNPAYESARGVFYRNALTDLRPRLVARCTGPDDVARCVEFAERHSLPLAVRSGGHCFAGWGTVDQGLVVDTSLMQAISVDAGRRVIRAGAGVLGGTLVTAAHAHGMAPVTGECPIVGIAGLTLGGGVGFLSGLHGATCDNLLAANLVLADGRRVTASTEDHQDLFWGIRGGGGNFGIATAFEYRMHPIGPVTAGALVYPIGVAGTVLRFFRDFMTESPDEFQPLAVIINGETPSLVLFVFWGGEEAAGEAFIRPLRTIARPIADTVRRMTYPETFPEYMGDYVEQRRGRNTRMAGSYLQHLTADAIEVILEQIAAAPGLGSAIGLDHYMHGAVCRVPADATAFELRAPGAIHVWIDAHWNGAAEGEAMNRWTVETWAALQPFSGGRAYANYLGAEATPAVEDVYRDGHARLMKLKRTYDPGNLFRRNFNIAPG